MLLGMRPALRLGRSSGRDPCERLEPLPMASPMAFPKVIGMEVLVVMSLSQVLSGALPAFLVMSQEVVPQRSLPVMLGEIGTYYDVSREPSLKVTFMISWGHGLPVVFPGYFL